MDLKTQLASHHLKAVREGTIFREKQAVAMLVVDGLRDLSRCIVLLAFAFNLYADIEKFLRGWIDGFRSGIIPAMVGLDWTIVRATLATILTAVTIRTGEGPTTIVPVAVFTGL